MTKHSKECGGSPSPRSPKGSEGKATARRQSLLLQEPLRCEAGGRAGRKQRKSLEAGKGSELPRRPRKRSAEASRAKRRPKGGATRRKSRRDWSLPNKEELMLPVTLRERFSRYVRRFLLCSLRAREFLFPNE